MSYSSRAKETSLSLALGRLVICAAWADGEVQREEQDTFKDILFQLPSLESDAWSALEALWDNPVDEEAQHAFLNDLVAELDDPEDSAFVCAALDRVVAADGVVTPEEAAFVSSVRERLGQPAKEGAASAPASQNDAERIGSAELLQRMRDASTSDLLSDRDVVAAALLRRVALASGLSEERVRELVVKGLDRWWMLEEGHGHAVADLILNADLPVRNIVRLGRLFFELTTGIERERFADIAFALATASDADEGPAVDEVMNIAANMRLSQIAFQLAMQRAIGDDDPVRKDLETV